MKQTPEDIALDERYIKAALQGDSEAFRWLVDKYQTYIFNLCWRVTLNQQDAADLTQETFLKLYTHLRQYKSGQKLSNWLYTIALNEGRKNLRRKKIVRFFSMSDESVMPQEPAAHTAETDEGARAAQTKVLLDRFIQDLPETLRPVFVLKYGEEMEDEEIAHVTGISLSNVRVRLHRARQFLWKKHGNIISEMM